MNKLLILSIAALSTVTFAELAPESFGNPMLQSRLDAIKGRVSPENPKQMALLQGFQPNDVTHKSLPIPSYDTGDQNFDTLAHVQKYRSRILDDANLSQATYFEQIRTTESDKDNHDHNLKGQVANFADVDTQTGILTRRNTENIIEHRALKTRQQNQYLNTVKKVKFRNKLLGKVSQNRQPPKAT